MGADMAAIHLVVHDTYTPERARTLLLDALYNETDPAVIDAAACYVDVDELDPFDAAVIAADTTLTDKYRRTIFHAYEKKLDAFETSLNSREVARTVINGATVYWTGGMTWGDWPTEAYGLWIRLLLNPDENPYADLLYTGYGFADATPAATVSPDGTQN